MSANQGAGGQAALKGFEYQDAVTVWVTLELMFARSEGLERVEIEPASHEDLAVTLPARGDGHLLSIQMKSRNKHWSKGDFVDLVGIPPSSPGTRGPARRLSPVERLAANPGEHYLLITDTTLDPSLQSLQVRDLLDLATAPRLPDTLQARLPQGTSLAAMASRITVLQPKGLDLLQLLTEQLLKWHLHVPGTSVRRCRESLTQAARAMMRGEASRFWTRQDIVATARAHGGAPAPSEELDDFVAPRNFEALKERLDGRHALVLLGPPGVGKTLVARKLAYEYQIAQEPFAFVPVQDPVELRGRLESTRDPTVFFVEDPFGQEHPEDKAERWLHALSGLLDEARPDKKIIVMSRLAVLRASGGRREFEQLRAEAMHLDSADYDASARWRLLQNKLKRAEGWQRALVEDHRDEILEGLNAPLSLRTFAAQVRKQKHWDGSRLRVLLRESAVDRIADIVAEEIRGLPWGAIPSALMLWSLLSGGPLFSREDARTWSDLLREEDRSLRVDIEKLIDWMLAASWLTKEPDGCRAHPQVTAGLEILWKEEPAQTTDVLSALFKGLLAGHDFLKVLNLASALPSGTHPLSREAHVAFDARLRSALLTAEGALLPTLYVIAARWLRGADDPITALVRALSPPPVLNERGFQELTFWRLPEWSEPLREAIRTSPEARCVAERFIRHVLPGINNVFRPQFVWDLELLGWHFPEAFAAAAPVVIREPATSLGTILSGAMACASPPFDELISLLGAELKSRWGQGDTAERKAAEQGHLDRLEAMALDDHDLNDYVMLEDGLEFVVAWRRSREGYAWLLEHPQRSELIYYGCKAIEPEDASLGEFRALLDACEPDQRCWVYDAIGRTRHVAAAPLLFDALVTADGRDARACLLALVNLWPPEALSDELRPLLMQTEERRAALVAMVGRECLENWHDLRKPEAQETVARVLFPRECTALRACIKAQADVPWPPEVGELPAEDRERLWRWARGPSPELHVAALRVLAAAGKPVATAATAMLESPVARHREAVIQALSSDPSREARALLLRALQDVDWKCRTAAIHALAPRADAGERHEVLASAKDRSWLVREACLAAIRDNRWTEGLETLALFLSDTQDRGEGYTKWARHHGVACLAAQALVEWAPLPVLLTHRLLDFLRAGARSNSDAMVHQQLMLLFMVQDVDGAFPLLAELLQSPMRRILRSQVHYPVRTGAAWALLQQLTWHPELVRRLDLPPLTEAALHPDPMLSGGACLLLGRMGPTVWSAVEPALGTSERWERAFLVGAEWIRTHHALPPESVRAMLPVKVVQGLAWLLACAPASEESWLTDSSARDWLAEVSERGAWRMFLRYYLQLYFHAPPPAGPRVESVTHFLKTLAYAFFVLPREEEKDGWVTVESHDGDWPAISTLP
ncbi:hypothetical protein [Melittangium boletus]|uniref:nSTAND3 domain-containing NTPase n=1 Tax=Melittangium boletus TaxID=83453 RepID=UPI003DA5F9D7